MNEQPVAILLVEDDPGHAALIEKNLRRGGVINQIIRFDDGQKAVDFLFKSGEYADDRNPAPLLVLLDLNLPVLDGCQVLQRIKSDERTRKIPVVMLTTTDSPQEIDRCYDLGCNIYVVKPVEYVQFSAAIRNLGLFLSIVKIPDDEPAGQPYAADDHSRFSSVRPG
jgi:CheY-like chemotaxis protein